MTGLFLILTALTFQNARADSCVSLSRAKYTAKRANFETFRKNSHPVRVIIGFRAKIEELNLTAILPGGRIIHPLKFVNAVSAEIPVFALEQIAKDPRVRVVELDDEVHTLNLPSEVAPAPTPEKQVIPPGVTRTGAPEVWNQTRGKGVVVAIIDTGIDKDHPDLAGRVIGGQNFSGTDRDAWQDGHGHGTHVSGTVAANDDNIGVVGMAPEASLLGIKVLNDSGSGSYSDVVAGIEYAITAKADIANMSLGSTHDIVTMHDALKKAHQKGLLVAAAAGNSGETSGNPMNYPGAYPEVIGVGAVDDRDLRAYFSTYNKFVALAGPGVDVLSLGKDASYARHNGTSMATPHVAGAAALLKSMHAEDSVIDLKRRLVCNAEDLWPSGRDVWTGYGVVNIKRALEQEAPESCDYLQGEVTEPELPAPSRKPDPRPGTNVVYAKAFAFSLLNDGANKQLLVTITMADAQGNPKSGIKVTSDILERATGPLGTAIAITNTKGEAQFVLKGFTCGKYIARVKSTSDPAFSTDYGQVEAEMDLGGER